MLTWVVSCHCLLSSGGWIGSEIGKTVERYDPEENKWEVIGSMAVPRYYCGCCELQGAETLITSTVPLLVE